MRQRCRCNPFVNVGAFNSLSLFLTVHLRVRTHIYLSVCLSVVQGPAELLIAVSSCCEGVLGVEFRLLLSDEAPISISSRPLPVDVFLQEMIGSD